MDPANLFISNFAWLMNVFRWDTTAQAMQAVIGCGLGKEQAAGLFKLCAITT